MKRRCPKCGAEWDGPERVGVREECPECAAFLHTCANCARFDADAGQCILPDVDPVRGPYVPNFCEEFTFDAGAQRRSGPVEEAGGSRTLEEEARRKFEDLFRDADS